MNIINSDLSIDYKSFDWIDTIKNISVYSISEIYNKSPLEIVSEPELKAILIKTMSEMVRTGHFLNIDFPENFINHNLKHATTLSLKSDNDIDRFIDKLNFIIKIANNKKIRINQTQKIVDLLKETNGSNKTF